MFSGAGEMNDFNFQDLHKKLGMMAYVYNSSTGEAENKTFLGIYCQENVA